VPAEGWVVRHSATRPQKVRHRCLPVEQCLTTWAEHGRWGTVPGAEGVAQCLTSSEGEAQPLQRDTGSCGTPHLSCFA